MRLKSYRNYIFLLIALSLAGCKSGHHETSKEKYEILTKKNTVKVLVKESLDWSGFSPWHLQSGEQIFVKNAWPDSKEQSCKDCHQGHKLSKIKGKKFKRSHWGIKLQHAPSQLMNCKTCHKKDAVWNFNAGEKAVIANQSAKLCVQCHFEQKKDWEMGAHGKRANGWQQKRAIFNCVSCHNPHSPSFKKRWPKVAPYRPINNQERL